MYVHMYFHNTKRPKTTKRTTTEHRTHQLISASAVRKEIYLLILLQLIKFLDENMHPSSLHNSGQKKVLNGNSSPNPIPLRKTQSANSSSLLSKTNSSFVPITAHYSLNQTLYKAFYRLCETKNYKLALSIGIQFCRVALFDIPLHCYYNSPKYSAQKMESALLVFEVSDLLPSISGMVASDAERKGLYFDYDETKDEVSMLQNVARNHYHELLHSTCDPMEQSHLLENKRLHSVSLKNIAVEKEILHDVDRVDWDCGFHNLSSTLCPVTEDQVEDALTLENKDCNDRVPSQYCASIQHRTQSDPTLIGINSCRSDESNDNGIIHLKSKESLKFDADLERALYLSGLEIQTENEINHVDEERYRNLKPVGSDIVEFNTLSEIYKDDFVELRNSSHIIVTYVDTYQGRLRGSLNGCTVIAPLLAIHHICSDETKCSRNSILMEGRTTSENPGAKDENPSSTTSFSTAVDGCLHDDIVRVVIDIQAPKILNLVRNKLNLHQDALIIPSDVHDYLIQQNILHQQQFIDVLGGNILNDDHLSAFITKFDETSATYSCQIQSNGLCSCKNVSATFFFHEHVVSIHKVTRHICTSIYDANGSEKKTKKKSSKIFRKLRKKKNNATSFDDIRDEDAITTVNEEHVWFDLIDSLPGSKLLYIDKNINVFDDFDVSSTARIRCKNVRSLHALLRWYAFTKFTPDDEKFIDSYQFDALNMEFDPRVFQAFLFAD